MPLVVFLLLLFPLAALAQYQSGPTDLSGYQTIAGASATYLPLSGGTMAGNFDMGNQNVTNAAIVDATTFREGGTALPNKYAPISVTIAAASNAAMAGVAADYVPQTRTLTINGTQGTMSSNLSFTVSGGSGLTNNETTVGTLPNILASNLLSGTYCLVRATNALSLANGSFTLISNLDVEDYDPENAFTTNTYITPAAGWYAFSSACGASQGGGQLSGYVTSYFTNGVEFVRCSFFNPVQYCLQPLVCVRYLPANVGVQIKMYCDNNSVSTLFGEGEVYFGVGRLK